LPDAPLPRPGDTDTIRDPVTVICMKWGGKYDARYVNILRSMVRRHCARPHRFVCLTDDRRGIRADVECMELPAGLPGELYSAPHEDLSAARRSASTAPERGWLKVGLFAPRIGDLSGTALYLDLDVVIIDDIAPLFDHPGSFCISPDWTWRGRRPGIGNSSVMRFGIGQHADLFRTFIAHHRTITQRFRNDQWFVSHHRSAKTFWPDPWCVSFKRHCVPRFPANMLYAPSPPPGAKIVIFHGRPNPPQAACGRSGKWHRHLRRSPWITDHWREDDEGRDMLPHERGGRGPSATAAECSDLQ